MNGAEVFLNIDEGRHLDATPHLGRNGGAGGGQKDQDGDREKI